MNTPLRRHGARTRSAGNPDLRGLYLLTPEEPDTSRLLARVSMVLGEACLLQYRNKAANAALRREQAGALLTLCRTAGVPLVINDDVELALHTGADGVHLGKDDGDARAAREALGTEAILGLSCYDDLARARNAAEAGADYIAFGAFFPSATKPHARRAAPSLLRDAAPLGLTRVAIGGITPDNARGLLDAGADLLAVVGGVFDAADPQASARAYRALFD
jgi:thiamine-phosphate pyrophosphorylase